MKSTPHEKIRRSVIWTLVYLIPAYQAMLPIEDPDIWWHLRTGQWILDHGYVPVQDPFSFFGAGKAWIAYSWLFEVLVYGLNNRFGLTGLVAFTVVMSVAIAVAVHSLIRRARLPFVAEAALLALIVASLKPGLSPRPWLFSMLFTAIELMVLSRLRRKWQLKTALVLPVLFALWANLHIQFIYGLAILVVLVTEAMFSRVVRSDASNVATHSLSVAQSLFLFALCFLATFVNPYHYLLYFPVVEYVTQTGAFQNISELHPMFFRSLADWLVLLLAVTGAFVLGWQRRWNIFHIAVFGMAAYAAFRARRDGWFLVIVVAAIISDCARLNRSSDYFTFDRSTVPAMVLAFLLCLYGLSYFRDVSEESLSKHVESHFPVKAVEFVNANRLEGPLYNSLDWGGYLIWSLPYLPVSMDGRTNLQGDERIARSLATWGGALGWENDPELLRARLIVAELDKPLTHLIRRDRRYRLVYEDRVAAVFLVGDGAL